MPRIKLLALLNTNTVEFCYVETVFALYDII